MQLYEPLSGEIEYMEVRRFPLFLLLVLWRAFLRLLVPFSIVLILIFLSNTFSFDDSFVNIAFGIYFLYACAVLILAFIAWFNDELDVLIVTNKRIIIFTQQSFFKRLSSIAALDQIQDVKGSMNGFIQNFFNIGRLDIQTAAEKTQFTMDEIPDPEKVAGMLNQIIQKEKELHEKNHKQAPSSPANIMQNDFLDQLVDTRGKLNKVF